MMRRPIPCLFVLVMLVTSLRHHELQAANLAQTLHAAAHDIVAQCQSNNWQSVGILKFTLEKGGKLSDNLGPMNTLLARRLEVAMVLANPPHAPLNLIEDASITAAAIDSGNHLSSTGRQKLLGGSYPLMWGSQKVSPDVLITGIGQISKDMRKIKIAFFAISKGSNDLASLGGDYTAELLPGSLSEAGLSYSVRGAFDGGTLVQNNGTPDDLPEDDFANNTETLFTSAQSLASGDGKVSHPLTDRNSAVRLEVRYDGRVVPFEIRGGHAFLREPTENQRVDVTIIKDATPNRYGVVAKINGQNTLGKQQRPDLQCSKWILSRPNEQVVIRGYQISQEQRETFRVLSKPESKSREFDYGSDVGTISVTVFGEGDRPKLTLDEDQREADVVESSELPEAPSDSFNALKAKLLADANRGLIVEGNRAAGQIRIQTFHANPTPLMSGTATYYQ